MWGHVALELMFVCWVDPSAYVVFGSQHPSPHVWTPGAWTDASTPNPTLGLDVTMATSMLGMDVSTPITTLGWPRPHPTPR